jgi:hypothetical protein
MSNFDQQPPQYYNGAPNNAQYGAPGQQQWNGQNGQYNQNGQQYNQYGAVNNNVPAYARAPYNSYNQDSLMKRWLVRSLIIRLIVYAVFIALALGFCGFIAFAAMVSH